MSKQTKYRGKKRPSIEVKETYYSTATGRPGEIRRGTGHTVVGLFYHYSRSLLPLYLDYFDTPGELQRGIGNTIMNLHAAMRGCLELQCHLAPRAESPFPLMGLPNLLSLARSLARARALSLSLSLSLLFG